MERNGPLSTNEELYRHLDDTYGLRNLRPEWISRQRSLLQNTLILSICNIDICEISQGSLPWRPQDAHSVRLGVKALVQIDEVVNVAAADGKAPTPRLLQFVLTDGSTNFVAFEIDPARSSFTTDTVPGTKLVLLPSTLVRRGRVVLRSSDYTLLGSPHKNIRVSGTGEAGAGSVETARFPKCSRSNICGFFVARSLSRYATNVIDVGGIANIAEQSDDGPENDSLWSENPAPSSVSPSSVRGRAAKLPIMGMNANRGIRGSLRRSSTGAQEPKNTSKAQAGRIFRTELTHERGRISATISRFSRAQRRNRSFTQSDSGREGTFPLSNRMAIEVPRSHEAAFEESGFETKEPTQGLERMEIISPESPRLVRLSDILDQGGSCATKSVMCRFYAMKTEKRMDSQLMTDCLTSTVVDDGTSIKVVTLPQQLVTTLRSKFPANNEEHSRGVNGGLKRPLRSICGFFQMKIQSELPVAALLVSEAHVSSSMLAEHLDIVAERYNNIYVAR